MWYRYRYGTETPVCHQRNVTHSASIPSADHVDGLTCRTIFNQTSTSGETKARTILLQGCFGHLYSYRSEGVVLALSFHLQPSETRESPASLLVSPTANYALYYIPNKKNIEAHHGHFAACDCTHRKHIVLYRMGVGARIMSLMLLMRRKMFLLKQ